MFSKFLKSIVRRCLPLVLVMMIGLVGCSASSSIGLTGNYVEDTVTIVANLKKVMELPKDAPERQSLGLTIHNQINDYVPRYRRNDQVSGLRSFTTMQTALNAAAGYYTAYGVRPLPPKVQKRLQEELRQVELAVKRGA